jgi:hypothetical protein
MLIVDETRSITSMCPPTLAESPAICARKSYLNIFHVEIHT